ncbi:C4-dicarboxylate ABC transporter permease [Desulfofundulus sp. TPOSR]|uniref:tripartite tricarboxylate transporter permease n=1 Tax=Desulfofundulus sp. TPOSR TaxID=2714340 RepID=UPI00140DC038|nr:tripartite tricarboxylate transporter permease [Desulfofundulus sp. TPOSR]NHM28751.1 C4-dicarboxylate ABC transporter permease [Desulfofundulus sp. TPOSR]
MEHIYSTFEAIFQFQTLISMLLGVCVGIIVGALPGLTPPIGMALFIPVTMGMDPVSGLLLLSSIYMGAEYGGSISAILLNTPGTAAAACTSFDGYPLARQGEGNKALYASITASTLGGIIGVIILLFFTPLLAQLSLKFGPAEMFWISIMGLALVSSLSGKNIIKGLLGAAFGILVSTVGMDPISGYPRFSFNSPNLLSGIGVVPALIGLFSISQMLVLMSKKRGEVIINEQKPTPYLQVLKFVLKRPFLVLRSSAIGTVVGILPGAGGSIASFLSYTLAKQSSKNPEKFGRGALEGVIASESANNAMVGGSLVPLLSLGIPGSASAAVLFGGLTLHGLIPGPRLFTEHADIAYGFMIGMLVTTILMCLVGLLTAKYSPFILKLPYNYIIATVLVLSTIGSYSVKNNLFDVWVMIVFGLLGYVALKYGFPIPPIVLGVILGPIAEEGYRRAIELGSVHGSTWGYFFGQPITVVLIIINVLIFLGGLYQEFRKVKAEKA